MSLANEFGEVAQPPRIGPFHGQSQSFSAPSSYVRWQTDFSARRRQDLRMDGDKLMKTLIRTGLLMAAIGLPLNVAYADQNSDTVALFKQADQSAEFFGKSYGYALFPTIGKAGIGIGAAHGTGDVYAQGKRIGQVTMNQISIGFQLGGETYSEIIFFENKNALREFTSGNFEFSGDIGAIAITASASASAGTSGARASASTDKEDASNAGGFTNGVAVFTIAKGGLMYNATVAGQKFTYEGSAVK